FFQAEDGIRDRNVTGVQTCALPILIYPIADSLSRSFDSHPEDKSRSKIGTFLITCIGNVNDITAALFMTAYTGNLLAVKLAANRSEERRVGKECRMWRWVCVEKETR